MTVIEAMKYLEQNPSERVISENGVVCDLDFFKRTECWSKVGVFGEWRILESISFEAKPYRHPNLYQEGSVTHVGLHSFIGKRVRITIKQLD